MSKLSQRKGRRAETADHREWRKRGYEVRDRRSLEAASVAVGVDYEVIVGTDGYPERLWVQRKHGKQPNAKAAFLETAKAVKHFGAGGRAMPVAHVTWDYGPDVAVMDWQDFLDFVGGMGEGA